VTATQDPHTGLHEESIYALWHDPTTYDHMKMGPPYLPEMKMRLASKAIQADVQKESDATLADMGQMLRAATASFGDAPMAELAALLAYLKAEAWVHQAHHWQTRGETYYGDHLLFERLYNDANGMVDSLAEKSVGLGNHLFVQPLLQGSFLLEVLKSLYGDVPVNPDSGLYPVISLRAVLRFLVFGKLVYGVLEQKGLLSHGLDNMLQGIADKHEEFAYLLKQRCKARNASHNPRSAAWKA